MVTIATFSKYIMVEKNEKISEISTLVAKVFCHNAPNNTHKSEKCLMVIQKWALEKKSKSQFLGFLNFT